MMNTAAYQVHKLTWHVSKQENASKTNTSKVAARDFDSIGRRYEDCASRITYAQV